VISISSRSTIRTFCQEISKKIHGDKIFSNQQSGMRIYVKLVVIFGLES
jgi:hypothetical protein